MVHLTSCLFDCHHWLSMEQNLSQSDLLSYVAHVQSVDGNYSVLMIVRKTPNCAIALVGSVFIPNL